MFKLVCAFILLSASLPTETSAPAETGATPQAETRELYERAARAIAAGRTERAQELLEVLTNEHAASPLAEIAVVHLAECYLLQGHPDRTLQLLEDWKVRLTESKTAEVLSPGIVVRLQELTYRALSELPADHTTACRQLEALYASIEEHREQAGARLACRVGLALARRHEDLQQFEEAAQWLERCQPDASADLAEAIRQDLEYRLPLAWASHALARDRPSESAAVLAEVNLERLAEPQQVPIRFALAHALLRSGSAEAAREQWTWLADYASTLNPVPDWAASVALRQAEMLLADKKVREAKTLLQRTKSEHPKFPKSYELDYLLARCAIADVEFEEAQDYLSTVIRSAAVRGTESLARASWMRGEVYFLQRELDQAISAYQEVIDMPQFPQWQARALLQAAKCYELQAQPAEALKLYERILSDFATSDVQPQAAERIAAMETTPIVR